MLIDPQRNSQNPTFSLPPPLLLPLVQPSSSLTWTITIVPGLLASVLYLPPQSILHMQPDGSHWNLSQILSLPCSKPSTDLRSQSKSPCKPRSLRPTPLVLTPFLTSCVLLWLQVSASGPATPFSSSDLCPLSAQGCLPWPLCENAKCPLRTPPATCPCFIVSHQLSAPSNMQHTYIFIFYIICLPTLLSASRGPGLAPVLETGPWT